MLGKDNIVTSFDLLIFDWKKGDSTDAFKEFNEKFNKASYSDQSKMIKELRMKNRTALIEYLKYERDPQNYI